VSFIREVKKKIESLLASFRREKAKGKNLLEREKVHVRKL